MSTGLTPYELRVLQSHQHRGLRESEVVERLAAQKSLSRLGYIRLDAGVYKITPEGKQILERSK
jgi:hypothetical protein